MYSKIDQEIIIRELGLDQLTNKGDVYNFRCPLCGDSDKDATKKRGYIFWYQNYHTYMFKCFNCGEKHDFKSLLKLHFSDVYKRELSKKFFKKEVKNKKYDFQEDIDKIKITKQELQEFFQQSFNDKKIIPFNNIKNEKLKNYLIKKRKIPENKLNNFYFTNNFYENIYIPLKNLLNTDADIHFTTKITKDPRYFWMIRNRINDVVGLQGRSLLKNSKIRYLTTKLVDEPMIGNIENVDISKRIYITEGYIDSLFIPNAVSLNGSSTYENVIEELNRLKAKEIVLLFDNEPFNKELNKNIKKGLGFVLSNKNIGICLLPAFLRKYGKDINEYYIYLNEKKENNKLLNIIEKNTFFGLKAKIIYSRWVNGK